MDSRRVSKGDWHKKYERLVSTVRGGLCRISCGKFPISHQQPWLIRKIDKHDTNWRKGEGDLAELVKSAFSLVGEDVSVYEVHSDAEEAMVLSAIALIGGSSSNSVYGIRLSRQELKSLGVEFIASQGDTGVPVVDAMHLDLKSSREVYEKIVEKFLQRQRGGLDHVRTVYDKQLHNQWQNFHEFKAGLSGRAVNALEDKIRRINSKK